MRTIIRLAGIATMLAVFSPAVEPALAANHVFVSAVTGNDGTCTGLPTAPCRSIFKAHALAFSGDVIHLETGGNYFSATITKSVTIYSANGGAIFGGETPCLTIAAGPTDVVNLDGIICIAANDGNHGILFNSGEKLRIRNSIIRGAVDTACGVLFTPNTNAELFIENTITSENGTNGNGGGVCVVPRSLANVFGVIDRLTSQNNRYGLRTATTSASVIELLIRHSTFSANVFGIRSIGANSIVRVSDSAIYKNTTGVSAASTGQLISVNDNVLRANTTDGAFTSTEAKQ